VFAIHIYWLCVFLKQTSDAGHTGKKNNRRDLHVEIKTENLETIFSSRDSRQGASGERREGPRKRGGARSSSHRSPLRVFAFSFFFLHKHKTQQSYFLHNCTFSLSHTHTHTLTYTHTQQQQQGATREVGKHCRDCSLLHPPSPLPPLLSSPETLGLCTRLLSVLLCLVKHTPAFTQASRFSYSCNRRFLNRPWIPTGDGNNSIMTRHAASDIRGLGLNEALRRIFMSAYILLMDIFVPTKNTSRRHDPL